VLERSITRVSIAVVLLLAAAACTGPPKQPSIGQAYVGPAVLKLRGDISLQSATVATVKHGDRLEIVGRHRRSLKVRAPNGTVGWTDERQLLATEDMNALRDLMHRAAKMPPQGQATSYGELNVHTQPSKQSPSFFQVKENEKVDVLARIVIPRTDIPRPPLIPPAPKKQAAPKRVSKKDAKYPPPPMPKPPAPPPNWMDLSKTNREEDETPQEEPGDRPVPTDSWALVRSHAGQAGWVLSRRLTMAIPDEVAQYAEGHAIISYFSLGTVEDGDQKKSIWLWATVGGGPHPYDFDSIRVFIWNPRRHRYETAYIERNLQGFSPVLVHDVDYSTGGKGRTQATSAKYPGFSICVEKQDGQRYRREYALLGNIVRFAGEKPCEAAASPFTVKVAAALPGASTPEPPPPPETLLQRFKRKLKSLTKGKVGG
jgi:hypothetical protein